MCAEGAHMYITWQCRCCQFQEKPQPIVTKYTNCNQIQREQKMQHTNLNYTPDPSTVCDLRSNNERTPGVAWDVCTCTSWELPFAVVGEERQSSGESGFSSTTVQVAEQPLAAITMLPSLCRLKTTTGILFSLHNAKALSSRTCSKPLNCHRPQIWYSLDTGCTWSKPLFAKLVSNTSGGQAAWM